MVGRLQRGGHDGEVMVVRVLGESSCPAPPGGIAVRCHPLSLLVAPSFGVVGPVDKWTLPLYF